MTVNYLSMDNRIRLEKQNKPNNQVTELILDNCQAAHVSGLTDEFINLNTLSIINVGLMTLKGFPKLPNLRKLYLCDNQLSNGLNLLLGCPKIQELNLRGNKFKDLSALDPLRGLQYLNNLDIYNCEITNYSEYRQKIFDLLPNVQLLDGFERSEKETLQSPVEQIKPAATTAAEEQVDNTDKLCQATNDNVVVTDTPSHFPVAPVTQKDDAPMVVESNAQETPCPENINVHNPVESVVETVCPANEDVSMNVETVDTKMDAIDTNVETVDTNVEALKTNVPTMDTNVQNIDSKVGNVDTQVETVATNVDYSSDNVTVRTTEHEPTSQPELENLNNAASAPEETRACSREDGHSPEVDIENDTTTAKEDASVGENRGSTCDSTSHEVSNELTGHSNYQGEGLEPPVEEVAQEEHSVIEISADYDSSNEEEEDDEEEDVSDDSEQQQDLSIEEEEDLSRSSEYDLSEVEEDLEEGECAEDDNEEEDEENIDYQNQTNNIYSEEGERSESSELQNGSGEHQEEEGEEESGQVLQELSGVQEEYSQQQEVELGQVQGGEEGGEEEEGQSEDVEK